MTDSKQAKPVNRQAAPKTQTKKQFAKTVCDNCGTALTGPFCHVCGQKGVELRRPVIGLLQDIIVETLSIDSRLYRTIWCLLSNPGKVARNYVMGHRARYTPPFRIFLFFSILFFSSIFLMINQQTLSGDLSNDGENNITINADLDGPPASGKDDENEDFYYQGPENLRKYASKIIQNVEQVQKDPRLFLGNLRKNIPRALFLMPLIYALLLLIFYFYKKNIFLYDLLIISLYMHGALYFYLSLSVLFQISPLDNVPLLSLFNELIILWGLFQSFKTLSVNFGSPWYSVMAKGIAINGLFWVSASALISLGMIMSLIY